LKEPIDGTCEMIWYLFIKCFFGLGDMNFGKYFTLRADSANRGHET